MDLEDKKKQLEIEKLEHEIKLQKKPFLFISTYAKIITVAFQLSTGVIAFLFAYKNNWFNLQNEKLEVQKLSLEFEIKEFTQKKQSIIDSISIYRHIDDSISEIVKKEQLHNNELKFENAELQKQISNSIINIDARTLFEKKFDNSKFVSHYSVGGIILDTSNKKIANANIIAEFFMYGKNQIKKAKSDSNGYFRINNNGNVLTQTCKLKITKKGYKDLGTTGQLFDSQRHFQFTTYQLHKNNDSSNEWDKWIKK